MAEAILNPTPDQTFRIEGRGDYDFSRTLRLSDEAQRRGAVDEACNLRFHAFQHLADLIPDNEEVILEWEHPNTQAALHLLYRSAVDHFLIDDFELSAAMLEFLLDLDPEDHEEATWLLAFDYVALADYDAFDEVINDVSDKYPEKPLLTLWSEYRRHGSLPAGEAIRLRNHFAPYYKEFTADSHPADDAYLRDIESERPTPQAQAADQLLGLAREHRPADHLYPPLLTGIFQKHKSLNWFSSAVPPLKTSLCFSPGRSRLMFKYLHSLPSVPSL